MGTSTCTLADLAKAVHRIAPPELAEAWDNVGLQVGHPNAPVRRVMTCLEVTEPTLLEAIDHQADAIVAHHPLIFKPMTAVNLAQPTTALVAELLRAEIGLVAAHTNLDSAAWGTNAVLAEALGLAPEGPLAARETAPLAHIAFTVRADDKSEAVIAARRGGALRVDVIHVNDQTKVVAAERLRVEAICPAEAREGLVRAVQAVAPSASAEDAVQSWPTEQRGAPVGLGLVARPDEPMDLDGFVGMVKQRLGLGVVRLSGLAQKRVRRVALCTGSGGSFVGLAAARADVYVTGEISYHHAIEARQRGLPVIEIGHFESEVLVARPLAARLSQDAVLREAGVQVFAAENDLQPFRLY